MKISFSQPSMQLAAKLLFACLLLTSVGCRPSARDALLVEAVQMIQTCITADADIERTLLEQVQSHKDALDAAFLADVNALAAPDGAIAYEDITQAKALYDARLLEVMESRSSIERLFERRRRLLEETHQLIQMARTDRTEETPPGTIEDSYETTTSKE